MSYFLAITKSKCSTNLGSIGTDDTFVSGGVIYSNLIIPIKDELIISPAMRELKDIKNRLALRKLVPVIYSSFQLDMKDPMDVDDLTTATAKCLKETTTLYALKIFGARLLTDITTKS